MSLKRLDVCFLFSVVNSLEVCWSSIITSVVWFCGSLEDLLQNDLFPEVAQASSASGQLPSRCQFNQLPVAFPECLSRLKTRIQWRIFQISHHPTLGLYMLNDCYPFVGYFWPHFSNKVSPKLTCLTLFFHIMEFLINGFVIILEDSASLICSDDVETNWQKRNTSIPYSNQL